MSAAYAPAPDPRPVTVALVNNMPDAAFVDTEGQFRRAMAADPGAGTLDLRLYTISEMPRSEEVSTLIRSGYRDLDELWADPPDALIVTGTEPAQAQLPYEPYWPFLARLLEWAAESVPTTLLSCLASHASVLLFDGIERVPRATKCSGVFAGTVEDMGDPLTAGLPDLIRIPHSRINDVPEQAMIDAGYRIVIGSGPAGAGWAVATRKHREALFLLCQGHPEYSTLSLLREYRRDVRRSLFGRGGVPYPPLPEGYLRPEGAAILESFAHRAAAPGADPRELWAGFPFEAAAAAVENTWAAPSAALYANWLGLARAAMTPSRAAQA
jgi:homoserine O-succinyltransferase/O-acetyltransferase